MSHLFCLLLMVKRRSYTEPALFILCIDHYDLLVQTQLCIMNYELGYR